MQHLCVVSIEFILVLSFLDFFFFFFFLGVAGLFSQCLYLLLFFFLLSVYLFCIRCLCMFIVIPFVLVQVVSYNKTVLSSERTVASLFIYVRGYKILLPNSSQTLHARQLP